MICFKNKNSSLVHLLLMMLTYAGLFVCSAAFAAEKFTPIVPPTHDGGASAVTMYYDNDDRFNILYQHKYPDKPSELFYVISDGEQWSSPILINKPSFNESTLNDAVRLENGFPLLLMQADSTDYSKVFNIDGALQSPNNPDDPIVPGISNEQLSQLLADNQRLFYSLQIRGKWTNPIPLPDSFRAVSPVLTAGDDGSALVVFARDRDKNPTTLSDFELYASAYKNNLWSKPMALTENNKAEYSVQVQYTGGAYLIVWVEDQDNNLENRSDSKLYYAVVNPDGTSKHNASTVVSPNQNQPIPALGRIAGQSVLMWMSQPISDENPQRTVWEARFENGWSTPINSGLAGYKMSDAHFYPATLGSILVYRDDSLVRIALNDGAKWTDAGSLMNYNQSNLLIADAHHFLDKQGVLHFSVAGHVRAAGENNENQEAGDGLFYLSKPLSHDLVITDIDAVPYAKYVGKEVNVKFKVRNNGAAPAAQYKVEVHSGGEIVKRLDGHALEVSAHQNFEYKFNIEQVDTHLEIVVISSGDAVADNNLIKYHVKVKPDYAVRSVVRKDATHFEVDIIERKGIAAAPVMVDVYLIDGLNKSKLTSGEFDTNSGFPMLIETTALIDKVTAYQILVNVNSERVIPEDKYSNNQGAYNHVILPDFHISQFYITSDHVYVNVSNKGDLPAGSVDILLTDNPLLARQGAAVDQAWYHDNIALDISGEGKLVIDRADFPALSGEKLYAVVNPHNAIRESDYNNNRDKVSLKSASAQGGAGGSDPSSYPQADLVLENIHAWCDNVQVTLKNLGDSYAIAPIVKLLDTDNYVIASTSLPTVLANTSETVTFNDIASGDFTVIISHTTIDGQRKTVSGEVSVILEDSCLNAANNDITLEEVSVEPGSVSDDIIVRLLLSTKGYITNYLKPLTRIPLQLEIKQGVQVHYSETNVLYLPVTANNDPHEVLFALARSVFPDGDANLNIYIQVRDDEASMANNVYTIVVNGKEL